jgi:cell shape-determining protein MreC
MSRIAPRNKINDSIIKVVKHLDEAIDEISSVKEYFDKYERNDGEREKLQELLELQSKLEELRQIQSCR